MDYIAVLIITPLVLSECCLIGRVFEKVRRNRQEDRGFCDTCKRCRVSPVED